MVAMVETVPVKFCENASCNPSMLKGGCFSSFSFVFGFTEENLLHKSAFFGFVKNGFPFHSFPFLSHANEGSTNRLTIC